MRPPLGGPADGRPTGHFSSFFSPDDELDDDAVAERQAAQRENAKARAVAHASVIHVEVGALTLYCILVGLLSAVVILSRQGQYDFYLADMVREAVTNSEFDPHDDEVAKTFHDVTTLTDVYHFLRGPLLAALLVETSYAGVPLPPNKLRRVNDQNVLLGPVRLYQARVVPGSACTVDSVFGANVSAAHIGECYAEWGVGEADTRPIVGGVRTGADAACAAGAQCPRNTYAWSDNVATGLGSFSGLHGWYDGSAYLVQLPNDQAAARTLLDTLRHDGFLGQATRALWIDFTIYNGALHAGQLHADRRRRCTARARCTGDIGGLAAIARGSAPLVRVRSSLAHPSCH